MLTLCLKIIIYSDATTTTTTSPATNAVNGCKVNSKLQDGPALAAVSGKRERRKKKFWDEEQEDTVSSISSSVSSSTATTTTTASKGAGTPTTSSSSSSALKRKAASVSTTTSVSSSRKSTKKSENKNHTAETIDSDLVKSTNGSAHNTLEVSELNENNHIKQPSGKENGKLLPYLQFDLNDDAELIAEKMVEGVNIPGMGQPIPVDSSSLPEGWEKRVIQRRIGITKGKWDVFITNPETGKSFRSKTELQKHLDERKLPYTSDAFDFSLDDNLKKLRQIWKQYKVKPFLNNPKGSGMNSNFRHVPAKITQVQDSDVVSAGRGGGSGSVGTGSHNLLTMAPALNSATPSSTAAVAASSSSTTASSSSSSSSSLVPISSSASLVNNVMKPINSPPPTAASMIIPNEMTKEELACLAEIAVESETGQGLRCSINKCGKLFRNNRLLRQHVKHYHPKIYDTLVCKHPSIGDDISEPTSPEAARRLSDNGGSGDTFQDRLNQYHLQQQTQQEQRRRKPSSEMKRFAPTEDPWSSSSIEQSKMTTTTNHKKRPTFKRSTLDEEAPLSSMYDEDSEEMFFMNRTRNDSVPSSVNSDTEELSVSSEQPRSYQQHQNLQQQQHHVHPRSGGPHCPPTPPTFRLSKRRQAQMRKRVTQPVVRMSKIEDTPLGRDYREEILNLATNSNTAAVIGSPSGMLSTATSPNGSIQDSACGGGTQNNQSYPPSEMDASVAGSEHLTSEELVNCSCRRLEEDGLMIQCDICLCWQHGYCVGIEDEDPVPEKHVCETCRQPPGGRSEARFSLDQDWLKEGKLPSLELCSTTASVSGGGGGILPSSSAAMARKKFLTSGVNDKETAFRKLSELMADLAHLDKVLHGLRVKLHVASQPSNNKVFMWSSAWSLPTVVQSVLEEEEEEEEDPDEQRHYQAVETPQNHHNHHPNIFSMDGGGSTSEVNKDQQQQPAASIQQQTNSQAVDPQAVADKLNMIKDEADDNNKLSNGSSDMAMDNDCANEDSDETSQVTAKEANDNDHAKEEKIVDMEEKETATYKKKNAAAATSSDQVETTKTDPNPPRPPLTNGTTNDSDVPLPPTSSTPPPLHHEGDGEDEENILDESLIPSITEVERLLPGVLQAMDDGIASGSNKVSSSPPTTSAAGGPTAAGAATTSSISVPKASTSKAAVIIPEPKRLDRDECRLNLLQHIQSVQSEIEKRFTAIEEAIGKIETMPGGFHAGLTPAQLQYGDNRIKSRLTMLIQDLAIARQLLWTL